MANLSFSATNSLGTTTYTSQDYSDATMTRFTDWCWLQYPQYVTPGDPGSGLKPKNNANVAAAVRDCFAGVVLGLKANVLNAEKIVARAAAEGNVTDWT